MCSFLGILYFILTQPFHTFWVYGEGLRRCPVVWQVAGSNSPLQLTWQAVSSSHSSRQGVGKNESPDGWEETLPFIWPHCCGRCREGTENGERCVLAENNTKSLVLRHHSKRTTFREVPDTLLPHGVEVPCQWSPPFRRWINLQRTRDLLSLVLDVPWLPQELDTVSVSPCQAHVQWNSLILIAILPWPTEGHQLSDLVLTTRISLINLHFLHF